MRNTIGLAGLAAAALAAGPVSSQTAPTLTPQALFAQVSPAVWMVQAFHDSGSPAAIGSAVVIGSRTLVTACHVLKGATSVKVTHDNGKAEAPVALVTHDPDHARDLCLLTVDEDLPARPAAIAPASSVAVGEPVYAIGAPLGLELSLTQGLVSALRPIAGEALPDIQVSAATAPGSSGGGLFDSQGRLVGVTVAIASANSENLTFAFPAEWVNEAPKRVGEARAAWRASLAAHGLPMGPDGDVASSGYAELSDFTKVPTAGKPADGVQRAYREFLLMAKPRAFILTSDGRWGSVTDAGALDALMKDCAARQVSCRFYAVDGAVVWRPQTAMALDAGGARPHSQ